MSRVKYSIAGLAIAMAGLWLVVPQIKQEPGIDMAVTGSINENDVYKLTSYETGAVCFIEKGVRVERGIFTAKPAENCTALLPGLSRVRFWHEKAAGVVELTGQGGEAMAAFAESDGRGYESFRPRAPFMALTLETKE